MQSQRYDTLDALRGIAALAVVAFHLGQVRLEPVVVPYGYLAVDFFFVLSGFVVAHAYERHLRDGLSWLTFFGKRLIRLYPLALLGALLGFALLLLKWRTYPGKVDPLPQLVMSGLLNSLMLPSVFGTEASRHELFPGNGPLWTLFFEMVANMVWAAVGIRLKTVWLIAFTVASGTALVAFDCYFRTANLGFDVATMAAGVARVGFSFTLGVVFYRMLPHLHLPAVRFGPALLGLALIAVLAWPVRTALGTIPWFAVVSTILVLPAIVLLAIGQGTSGRFGAILGRLSYPVYVLHFPVILLISGLHQSVLVRLNVHLLSAACIVLILGLAMAALAFYDEPARRFLTRALASPRKAPHSGTGIPRLR